MLRRAALVGAVAGLALLLGGSPAAASGGASANSSGFVEGYASQEGGQGEDGGGRPRSAAERAAARERYQAYLYQLRREHEQRVRVFPECNPEWGRPEEWCAWVPPESGGSARPPRQAVENYVRTVTASMQLPEALPQIGPDPAWNEWNMAVVGVPLWLWVDGPSQMSESQSEAGLEVSLRARHVRTDFIMGDGRTVTCAATKPYVRGSVAAGTPSPVCGHTYEVAPKVSAGDGGQPGTYTVTATTHWSVEWTAGGYSGTLTTQMAGSRDIPVGELQAIVVRR